MTIGDLTNFFMNNKALGPLSHLRLVVFEPASERGCKKWVLLESSSKLLKT